MSFFNSRQTAMTEEAFFEIIGPPLTALGSVPEDGEEFRSPPLDVLAYYRRAVRLHWVPWFGQGLSVVAVVRQPVDVGLSEADYTKFLTRVAMAVNGRFPPIGKGRHPKGLALGLTLVVLTPEPIKPGDDDVLGKVVTGRPIPRQRAVPLGVLRVNLGQEALSFTLANGPEGVFSEPMAVVDCLTPHLRRYVPMLEV